MNKYNLRYFTILGIGSVVLILNLVSFNFSYRTAKSDLVKSQLNSGHREVREIGKLLELQLKSGLAPEEVINNLQLSIINTDVQAQFICMYNTKGIELCHPDPAMVGQVIDAKNSMIKNGKGVPVSTFLQWLEKGKAQDGIRSFPSGERPSEIVNVYPVQQTDWMVALHVNIRELNSQLSSLYNRLLLIYLSSVLVIISFCYLIVRVIYRNYEKAMESEKVSLNREIDELSLLNRQLIISQERLHNLPVTTGGETVKNAKQRLVTYYKDELIKVDACDIAFILLQNGITCLHTFHNDSYTINESLDEIYKDLDSISFYRANRQVIVHIEAIRKIQLYGNSQLKLILKPDPGIEIIISKNKVADFKYWLNQ